MSNAEYRNAIRVWNAVNRIIINAGEVVPMTVGEVAKECGMSLSAVRKYMNLAVGEGQLTKRIHSKTMVTYTQPYGEG